MTCTSEQALKILKARVIEALNTIVTCLPSAANVAGLSALVNRCSTFEAVQSVLDLALGRAVCYLNSISTGNVTNLGQDFVFPELVHGLDNLFIYNAFAGSFTFPLLEDAQRGFYISYTDENGDGSNMSFLRFVSAPIITSIQDTFFVGRCPLLTSVSMPLLNHVGNDISIASNARLAAIDLSSLAFLGRDFLASGSILGGLRLDAMTHFGGTQFLCDANQIPTVDINALLIKLQSLSVTGVTINFAGGGNGPPSGAGLTAKAALIMAGNTVSTN